MNLMTNCKLLDKMYKNQNLVFKNQKLLVEFIQLLPESILINPILTSAIIKILRPLVRMLLKRGVSYGTFADVAKWVFADVAKKEFEIPGKKISDSRVSVITGLTRHEIKKLLATTSQEEFKIEERHHRATSIINGWRFNKKYHDKNGVPAELPMKGSENSFESLVKEYGGDITFRSILDELVRSDSLELLADSKIRLKRKRFLPNANEEQILSILGEDVSALIKTIDHNIENPGKKDFLQLNASSQYLAKANMPFIQYEMKKKGITFLQELDAWLMTQEVEPKNRNTEEHYSGGLGIYYFEDTDRGEK